LDYQGLINYIPTEDDANSNTLVSIQGEHINTLLKRRTVAYPEGHAQADKTGYADDLMKAYVSYNLGANATTGNGREANGNLSSTYFGVQANTSLGPSTSMNASQMVLMTALQKLSAQARQAGTEVYWDIQSVNDAYCEFRTATGQMGMPRTADLANGLTFGKEFGNLQRPRLVLDARKEANRVYGLGRGQQSAIDVQTADDTERQGASIFALKEKAIRASVDSAGCLAAAQAALVEARPMYVFSGELTDNADSVYGLNWYRGDTVTVTYAGLQFSAHVRKIAIALSSDRRETTLAAVEAYL
jgi:hypothetical protein